MRLSDLFFCEAQGIVKRSIQHFIVLVFLLSFAVGGFNWARNLICSSQTYVCVRVQYSHTGAAQNI